MSETDYSATIIYKIMCKDESNKDIYVGHTVNFVKRKYSHRYACTHADHPQYNSKVYTVIRENGGWDNWRMKLIHAFDCKNLYEAREKEQEYYVLLNATLNSIEPLKERKIKETKKEKIKPIIVRKHVKEAIISCSLCTTSFYKKNDWDRHILTNKHNLRSNILIPIKIKEYKCACGKKYSNNSGLWKHTKVCKGIVVSDRLTMAEMFEEYKKTNELYKKENKDFQQQLLELLKER
jgi:hypothetical protein